MSVVFPEMGRAMIREDLSDLLRAPEDIGFPGSLLLSSVSGCCLPAELTEQPACVITRKVKQFILNSPLLAI